MYFVTLGAAFGALVLLGAATTSVRVTSARSVSGQAGRLPERVLAQLPAANCGACGKRSCLATAVAIADGTAPIDACVFGGRSVAAALAELMEDSAEA